MNGNGYHLPPLDRRVILQDQLTEFQVWANRKDRRPFSEFTEGGKELIRAGRSLFTIRWREGIAPSVRVIDRGVTFFSIGHPVEKFTGGLRYLEINAERRSSLPAR